VISAQEIEFLKARGRLVVETHSGVATSAIRVPESRARHFANSCSTLQRANKLPRTRLMLRLLAKTAARTCSVVFYCAVPNISGEARLKGRLSA